MQVESDRGINRKGNDKYPKLVNACESAIRVVDEFSKWSGILFGDKAPTVTLISRGLALGLKIIAKRLRNR